MKNLLIILFMLPITFISCINDKEPFRQYKTQHVVIIVIDGVRYSESWGDTTHQYIPYFSNEIADFGVVNTSFYHNGRTLTNAGHTAITSGNYQEINNSGAELPKYPSIFQYLIKTDSLSKEEAWIITSKDKLAVLGNCKESNWEDKYLPSLDCGIDGNGVGSGYRHDTITLKNFFNVLSVHKPKLTLVSFREPDGAGHANSWEDYLQEIRNTDEYIYKIWKYIQNDAYYSGTTTLFITNDHGRHSGTGRIGFQEHGCSCSGCRHINFFAYGPDFRNGVIDVEREIIDISATIAEIFHFNPEYIEGEIMHELFN